MGQSFLILIDSHSKWLEVHPMTSTTSSATIQCLRRVFAQLGLPEQLVTDNGPNLVSAEFEEFLRRNGVKHTMSAPYHPASNGLAERAVQIFKQGMRKMSGGTLSDKIARFLFSYRITPQSTTGTSPAELLMGRKLRSPLDLLKPDLCKRVEREQERQKQAHDQHAQDRSLKIGEAVYVRNFGCGSTWLPGHIVEQTGPLSFKVELTDGRVMWRRHQDHVRKRYAVDTERPWEPGSTQPEPTQLTVPSVPVPQVEDVSAELPFPQYSPSRPSDLQLSEQTALPDSGTDSTVPEGSRRYPQRIRKPPDRYTSD